MTAVQTFPRKANLSRTAMLGAFLFVGAILLLVFFVVRGRGGAQRLTSEDDLLALLAYVPDRPFYREYVALGNVDALHLFNTLPFSTMEIGPDSQTRLIDGLYGLNVTGLEWFIEAGDRATVIGYRDRGTVENALVASEFYQSAPALETGGSRYQRLGELQNYENPFIQAFLGDLVLLPEQVVLFDGHMMVGRDALVINAQDAREGEIPSLAANPAFRAAVTAIVQTPEPGEGDGVGLIVMGERSRHSRILGFNLDADSPVDFTVGAFALRCVDEAPQVAWALVFPEETDIEAASAALTEQVQEIFYSGVIGRWALATTTEIEVENLPVAVVTARSRSLDCESP